MRDLPQFEDERLLVGSSTSDDAAVYALSDDLALVQTLDFFTPIVDDPFLYGQIAATNSLSDVYAMGGKPITAMNVAAMPSSEIGPEVIREIFRGGSEKVKEASCSLAGGHTVRNTEPLYGLSVTGVVNPNRMMTNAGAKPGDLLMLSKPLGTGILATAIKRKLPYENLEQLVVETMLRLNTPGMKLAELGLVSCATDVTGFGLLGHLISLCRASGVSAHLEASKVPSITPLVRRLIEVDDCAPGGTHENLETASENTIFSESVTESDRLILADAQTSGGLLLCVRREDESQVADILAEEESLANVVIGEIGALSEQDSLVSVS